LSSNEKPLQRNAELECVYAENFEVDGARKVWRQLHREDWAVVCYTVAWLMARFGLDTTTSGEKKHRTTIPDPDASQPPDLVNRQFQAEHPGQLCVADFTYVVTWSGVVYVAFVIPVSARQIVGCRTPRTVTAESDWAAFEHDLWVKGKALGLISYPAAAGQDLAIQLAERLVGASIQCSAESTGDSHDNSLAESLIRLFKIEIAYKQRE